MSRQLRIPKVESLRFEGLGFVYPGQEAIFENLDFELPMNQNVWLRAHGGAGRSTLLQILAGLVVPTAGKYLINGQDVSEMSFEEFLPYRLAIGYGFDLGGLIHNRNLFENLMLPLTYHKLIPQEEAVVRVQELMKKFDIYRYKDQRPTAVQGGVRKLICVLRPLVLNPQILLLDDPTVGLGQENSLKYFDLLEEYRVKRNLQHIFISSYDEKTMSLMKTKDVWIVGGMLHAADDEENKVVSL